MLLFTREQFHLNFIQVYLSGGQSIFQDGTHQLIYRFQLDQTGSRSVDRILFVLTAPEGQRKDHCQSCSEGHRDVAKTTVLPGGYGAENLCQ